MSVIESKRAAINAAIRAKYGDVVTRQQLLDYKADTGDYAVWIRRDASLRVGRGQYRVPGAGESASVKSAKTRAAKTSPMSSERLVLRDPASTPATPVVASRPMNVAAPSFDSSLLSDADAVTSKLQAIANEASELATVPAKNGAFVPFGDYDMIRQVVASRKFFPVFITGLSGNGKTFGVEQACAAEGREYIRANVTLETDEDDLLGGFRLKNGSTVFELGPAVVAMLRGAVLLLDELDLASSKIMCLQPILEGKPITLKKLGITIAPAEGFTVFATANTKGRGDESGKFIGAGLLNEAFLERFPITVEQEYPSIAVEKKILSKTFEQMGYKMTPHAVTFFDTLSRWAEAIRVTYKEGGIDDLISTRRLVHIVRAYAIFGGDDSQALGYCVNRFEPKTKDAFTDLYNKLAPDAAAPSNVGSLDGDAAGTPGF
jgi:MoxR-like ATPase